MRQKLAPSRATTPKNATFMSNKMIVRAGERCCGRSMACPGLVCGRGGLIVCPDQRTAISDGVDMVSPRRAVGGL